MSSVKIESNSMQNYQRNFPVFVFNITISNFAVRMYINPLKGEKPRERIERR